VVGFSYCGLAYACNKTNKETKGKEIMAKQIIKKIVNRKCCVRCGWWQKHSIWQRNAFVCPECRGELLYQRGIVTTQTNAWFQWKELEFEVLTDYEYRPKNMGEYSWEESPVWLE